MELVCRGKIRRDYLGIPKRRRSSGTGLTLRCESWGANRIRYPGSPRPNDECYRWSASHFSDAANALNIPPGEYGRKVKTQRNRRGPAQCGACGLIRRYAKNLTWP